MLPSSAYGAMNICRRFVRALVLLLAFGQMASAQLSTPSVDSIQTRLQSLTILGNHSENVVTGALFSAIEESLYSQKQPDGGYQDRSSLTTHISRDSEGRTRAERYITSHLSGAGKPRLQSVYIADPVAGVLYRLD
jgi:hypothetical protein